MTVPGDDHGDEMNTPSERNRAGEVLAGALSSRAP